MRPPGAVSHHLLVCADEPQGCRTPTRGQASILFGVPSRGRAAGPSELSARTFCVIVVTLAAIVPGTCQAPHRLSGRGRSKRRRERPLQASTEEALARVRRVTGLEQCSRHVDELDDRLPPRRSAARQLSASGRVARLAMKAAPRSARDFTRTRRKPGTLETVARWTKDHHGVGLAGGSASVGLDDDRHDSQRCAFFVVLQETRRRQRRRRREDRRSRTRASFRSLTGTSTMSKPFRRRAAQSWRGLGAQPTITA